MLLLLLLHLLVEFTQKPKVTELILFIYYSFHFSQLTELISLSHSFKEISEQSITIKIGTLFHKFVHMSLGG